VRVFLYAFRQVLPFGPMSAYEQAWFDKMLPDLKAQIQKGVDFANK
jgi:malate dehydrogenase